MTTPDATTPNPVAVPDAFYVVKHVAALYRRTMDGDNVETIYALVGSVRFVVYRHHFGAAELCLEDRESPLDAGRRVLGRLTLPRRGVFTGVGDDVEDEMRDALPRIARAAMSIAYPDCTSMLASSGLNVDSLALLVSIYLACAQSQCEHEAKVSAQLEAEWAAEGDGGAA